MKKRGMKDPDVGSKHVVFCHCILTGNYLTVLFDVVEE